MTSKWTEPPTTKAGRPHALRRVLPLAAAVLLAATVAACGSSDSDSDTTTGASTGAGAAAQTTAAAKPEGSPLTLMVSTGVDTPQGSYPGDFAGAQAAALEINARGGVNGHPLEVITCNNENTPAGATRCVRQAVSEKVAAVVGTIPFGAAVFPTLEKAKVPSSLFPIIGMDLQAPTNFPINGGGFAEFIGEGIVPERAGVTKLGIICGTVPGFDVTCANAKAIAESKGTEVAVQVPLSPTSTTFGGVIQELKSAGVDGVLSYTPVNQIPPLVQAGSAVGFNPTWVSSLDSFPDPKALESTSKIASKLWLTSVFPPVTSASEYPGMSKYIESMEAADEQGIANATTEYQTGTSIHAWAAVHGLAEVAKTIDGEVTSTSLLAALKKAKDINIADLVTWSPGAEGLPNYPGLKDDALVYVGPVVDGVYTPDPKEPIAAAEGVSVK